VPTLVVAGSEDPLFSLETLREIAGWIPGAVFVEIAGPVTPPTQSSPEEFNCIVDEFIRAHASAVAMT
jgi:pimeloyl-ACP methyl ester carboxylesterase